MAQPVGDHIIQRLSASGVRTIYGDPGGRIHGLIQRSARQVWAERAAS
jgi:thiamine pyrophosphate-dependent acetolactate synthase large subunit-like protein